MDKIERSFCRISFAGGDLASCGEMTYPRAMLDAELLALLVCPETHQDVTLATSGEIVLLNEAIRQGRVRTAGGKGADAPVEGALIRIDRAVAYPIRDGIPVMLVPEGLVIRQINLHG